MTRNKYIFYTQEEIETYQMFRLTKFVMFSVLHCEKKRVFMRFALNHCIFFYLHYTQYRSLPGFGVVLQQQRTVTDFELITHHFFPLSLLVALYIHIYKKLEEFPIKTLSKIFFKKNNLILGICLRSFSGATLNYFLFGSMH